MGYPFSEESKEELLRRFPEPVPVNPPHWDVSEEEEEHTEAYLRNPPDPGPLSGTKPTVGLTTPRQIRFESIGNSKKSRAE